MEITATERDRQVLPSKRKFFRYPPEWLPYPQDWISDNARKVLLAMIQMADRDGALRIPGKEATRTGGWISGKAIDRKAECCTRIRKSAVKELTTLRYVSWKRSPVIRTIHGRKRSVRGETHYFVDFSAIKIVNPMARSSRVHGNPTRRMTNDGAVSGSSAQRKPNNDAHSSTVHGDKIATSGPQNTVSSTVHENGNSAKNTSSNSSTVPFQNRSRKEPTKEFQEAPSVRRAGVGVAVDVDVRRKPSNTQYTLSQDSPAKSAEAKELERELFEWADPIIRDRAVHIRSYAGFMITGRKNFLAHLASEVEEWFWDQLWKYIEQSFIQFPTEPVTWNMQCNYVNELQAGRVLPRLAKRVVTSELLARALQRAIDFLELKVRIGDPIYCDPNNVATYQKLHNERARGNPQWEPFNRDARARMDRDL